MADQTSSRMLSLSATIHSAVSKMQNLYSRQQLTPPSFDEDAPSELPKEALELRDVVLDASSELYDLLLDPMTLLFQKGAHNNMVCLRAISEFNIATLVPPGGEISFREISTHTGLDEDSIQRFLRHAVTMRIFREPRPGVLAHTQASKLLSEQPTKDWMATATEDVWPTAVKVRSNPNLSDIVTKADHFTQMVDAMRRWPNSQEPNETGFTLASGTNLSIYEDFNLNPQKAMRFSNAMEAFASSPGHHISYVLESFDWGSLGVAQVVDIGGAHGHVAIELAKHFPNVSVIVQDTSESLEGASVPDEVAGRVEFMPHDFFEPQCVKADVYYFRWVMHNWSDKYCILILRALIPSLEPGAKILIQDTCMPEPGSVALWREKDLRERTAAQWNALLTKADERFVLGEVVNPKGSALAMIQAVWNG
ncbi:uncharacterized protein PG986_010410 [Apiospora aurea]|uniref:O-methyltransferase domain-containing protein n=1 Tax=Apiospora aurea TaxID=335848 RepID=A0ABR1Q2V2_9PEZI